MRRNTNEAARYIGMSVSWLNKDRQAQALIPYLKIGTKVVYETEDLDAFLAKSRRRNTAENPQHEAA